MKHRIAFLLIVPFFLGQGVALGVVGEGLMEKSRGSPSTSSGRTEETSSGRAEMGKLEYVPGELIVKLKEGKTLDDLKELNMKYGVLSTELVFKEVAGRDKETPSGLDRIYILKVAATADIPMMVATYQAHPAVEYAEPNYMVEIQKEASSLSTQ